jgi:nitroreductase
VARVEFRELVVKRRSIRSFKKDKIPDRLVLSVLEACRWSPSAGNSQPWRIIVVSDVEVKNHIGSICTKYSRQHWKSFSPERARYLAARGGKWDKSYMKEVPLLLVVCYENQKGYRNDLVFGSTWLAVENMLLAITDKGLGGCIYTCLNKREENELKKALRVPLAYRIACMIQTGYADVEPPQPSRKKLEEIVSYQHF